MSEQIDITVDLGVIPPLLAEILTLRQLVETAPTAPPQVIEGVLHVGGHPEAASGRKLQMRPKWKMCEKAQKKGPETCVSRPENGCGGWI